MLPSLCARSSKLLSHILFALWAGGTLGLVSWLGASHVMAPVAPSAAPENVVVRAEGWALVHWLRGDDADSLRVAEQLAQRRLPTGSRDEVRWIGGSAQWRGRLAAAGWRVVTLPEGRPGEYPRMDVLDPSDHAAWSGRYVLEDLRTSGAMVLDELVLTRVARGDRLPQVVPAACVARLNP